MPTVGTGRIDPGTGDVSFNGPEQPVVPGLSANSSATFTDVRSVTGNNLGGGAGLFSGVNGATDVVLDFKSIVGGRGINVSVDATTITITATGTLSGGVGGASAFIDLTDGPGAIAPRGILAGNANGDALVFIPAPNNPDAVLSWTGSSFSWTTVAPGVSSVELSAFAPLAVQGSPITSNGTFVLSLQTSGVASGTYNRVVVDEFGRVTEGDNAPSGVASLAIEGLGPIAVQGSPVTTEGTFVLSLQTSGVTVGTYNRVAVDEYGRVIDGDNVPSGVARVQIEAVAPLSVQGDPITSEGTFVLTVQPSGVSAGTYNRVAVDELGRVVAGENVASTDDLQSVMQRGPISDQNMHLTSTLESTGPNTGALIVDGGVGIGDDLFVGGDLTVLGVLNASISGAAQSADRLTQNRQIALTGAAIGQGSFDGSADLSIATELNSTGVTPGTYTRVEVTADGRVVFGGSISPADVQPLVASLNFTDLTVSGNLTVGGDALVGGNFTSVNTENLTVDDTYILLGGATPPTGDDGRDRGVAFRWHNGTSAQLGFFGFRRSNGRLTFQQGLPESVLAGGIFNGTLGSIEANITGSAESAQRLTSPRTISLVGAVTGAVTTDFSGNATLTAAFGPVGTAVGTFTRVVVDSSGRIVSGSSPAPSAATINIIGDVVGSGAATITASLANVTTPGTFTRVIIDAKGRVISGSTVSPEVVNLTGDVTGTGAGTIAVSLANVGSAGTFTRVVTDAKGRVISGTNPAPETLTLTGDVSGTGAGSVVVSLVNVATAGTYDRVVIDAKGRVLSGTNPPPPSQAIIVTGDVSGSGTTGSTTTLLLSTTGVVAGTYDRVVVDSRGRVTAGTNPIIANTISLAGDATGVGTLGSSLVVALANTGVTAGTYSAVVVDAKGRVTGGSTGLDNLADVTARGATTSSNLTLSGTVAITSTTPSTTSTSGALRVSGGLGVAGDLNTAATSSVNLGIGVGTPLAARLWVTGNYGANIAAVAWASSIALNLSTANNFSVTLTGTTNFANPSNPIVGQSGIIVLTQDGTGNRVVSFGSNWRFPNNTAPANTTTANAVDIVVYTVRATGAISAVLIPNV